MCVCYTAPEITAEETPNSTHTQFPTHLLTGLAFIGFVDCVPGLADIFKMMLWNCVCACLFRKTVYISKNLFMRMAVLVSHPRMSVFSPFSPLSFCSLQILTNVWKIMEVAIISVVIRWAVLSAAVRKDTNFWPTSAPVKVSHHSHCITLHFDVHYMGF